MSRPPVSIVLPTRDRPRELDATLAKVAEQLGPDDFLLVADSASREPQTIAAIARRHGADVLRIDRAGAARARNAGWRATGTDIVVFVDDTVSVAAGWLTALVAPLIDEPQIGFVSGRVDAAGGRPGAKPVAVHAHDQAVPVLVGNAAPGDSASLAVRRSALEAVGGFDERLGPGTWFTAADDLDLLDRILMAGWTGWFEPVARAWSPQPETRREVVSKVWDYGKASGGRLSLLARRDARVALSIARQVLPSVRRRSGMAMSAPSPAAPRRTPLLAAVRTLGTVAGFAAGLTTLRVGSAAPTRSAP